MGVVPVLANQICLFATRDIFKYIIHVQRHRLAFRREECRSSCSQHLADFIYASECIDIARTERGVPAVAVPSTWQISYTLLNVLISPVRREGCHSSCSQHLADFIYASECTDMAPYGERGATVAVPSTWQISYTLLNVLISPVRREECHSSCSQHLADFIYASECIDIARTERGVPQ